MSVKWPTTLILLSTVGAATLLGLFDKVDSAAVTSILGMVVGSVGVGHYVKTTLNGQATNAANAAAAAAPVAVSAKDEGP